MRVYTAWRIISMAGEVMVSWFLVYLLLIVQCAKRSWMKHVLLLQQPHFLFLSLHRQPPFGKQTLQMVL